MPGTGFKPGPVDERDHLLSAAVAQFEEAVGISAEDRKRFGYVHHKSPRRLNQGQEGHCVGFGLADLRNIIENALVYDNDAAHELFCEIAESDSFEGSCESDPPQDGTAIRPGLDVLLRRGEISRYAFETDELEAMRYVLNYRPVVLGVPWFSGMRNIDSRGFVSVSGRIESWHCICVNEVNLDPDDPDWVGFDNSWGQGWGDNGRGRIWRAGLRRLMSVPGATIATVVDVPEEVAS